MLFAISYWKSAYETFCNLGFPTAYFFHITSSVSADSDAFITSILCLTRFELLSLRTKICFLLFSLPKMLFNIWSGHSILSTYYSNFWQTRWYSFLKIHRVYKGVYSVFRRILLHAVEELGFFNDRRFSSAFSNNAGNFKRTTVDNQVVANGKNDEVISEII